MTLFELQAHDGNKRRLNLIVVFIIVFKFSTDLVPRVGRTEQTAPLPHPGYTTEYWHLELWLAHSKHSVLQQEWLELLLYLFLLFPPYRLVALMTFLHD